MKILAIGDIYGKTGRETLVRHLKLLKDRYQPDWIIANGENATAGNGLSSRHARQIKDAGVDIITSGNHIFARADWPELLTKNDFILRPHNIAPEDSAGCGLGLFEKPGCNTLAVMNIAGRVFMEKSRCPFKTFDFLLSKLDGSETVFVDFHAEATSEKQAFFWYVNQRANVVVGTHTHVQTSDERVLPGEKTFVITDLGMTGGINSIIGVETETIVARFVKGFSDKFKCSPVPAKTEGVMVDVDKTGVICSFDRFRIEDQNQNQI